jgi:HEAT repeat protein
MQLKEGEYRWTDATVGAAMATLSAARTAPAARRLPTIRLRGMRIHRIDEHTCIEHILSQLAAGRGGFVVTPNLDHLRRSQQDVSFSVLVEEANLVVADGMPLVWLTGVPSGTSIEFLEKLVRSDDTLEGAILAISLHDDPQADTVMEKLTHSDQPEKTRDKAIFWLGVNRGARGVEVLGNLLKNDPSEHIRDKAVFGLFVSKQPEALALLINAAKNDPSGHVRGQALFWLAQKAGQRASAMIVDAIRNDPDTEVKKRAVFALSQLPKDEGVPKLIEVAQTQRNAEVRKQAFFWLGQSQDPRAARFIEEVLTGD